MHSSLRVTVGTILGLLAAGTSRGDILAAYCTLKPKISTPHSPMPWRLKSPKNRSSCHEREDFGRHESVATWIP